MNPPNLAVCSWSLRPKDAADLVAQLRQTGLSKIQLQLDLLAEDRAWSDAGKQLHDAGIELVSGMVGCVGEDYSTIESIHRTGGVVPDSTWPATEKRMIASAKVALALGIKLVTFHAGFIPRDSDDPVYAKLITRISRVARIFGDSGARIALETGQESAPTLEAFLATLPVEVGVNFDPANMLLYGSGEPVAALRLLRPRVRQIHLKDATPPLTPGEWGNEVVLGTGRVDWKSFFNTLRETHYTGEQVIEREAGPNRVADIRAAVEFHRKMHAIH